jgi:hypothetical protein
VPHAGVVVAAFVILMLAVVGVFVLIPFVSNYAFWVAVLAYVILHWVSRIGASWPGIISLLLLGARGRWGFHKYPLCEQLRFLVRGRCLSRS